MLTEREAFMLWLRQFPGMVLTPGEATRRWQRGVTDGRAVERYRRNVERYPDPPQTEEHD